MEAFSDAGGGLCLFLTQSERTGSELPMSPHACGSTNQKLRLPEGADSRSLVGAPPPALVAMVNVYVLVTSVKPLTSFLHDITVVTTNQERRGRPTKLRNFLLQQFGPNTSHDALGQMKKVIGEVLLAAVSTNQKQQTFSRCVLCFQLLTFSLLFSGSITPLVVQVETDCDVVSVNGVSGSHAVKTSWMTAAIVKTMLTHCRCHGVSGSCAVKTCWKTVAPFERVGAYLKQRYEQSVQVWDRSKRKPRRKQPRLLPVAAHQLVYFNKSPNYCVADRRRGVAGTSGRRCSRTSTGPDSCVLLCCGRGYNTHLVRHVQRCECKFVWCCYVHCRRCESMNDMHTCK
ncbi:uncharacterized protein LOC144532100 [Sander vitreus]